jgi:putative ABC transport system permease protein
VLRATGLTQGQVWGLVVSQTGLMGVLAGVFALPLGVTLALILIRVVNRRSFGWSLDVAIDPALLAQGLALAVGAALLAGVYPAWRMARASPARALREE